MWLEPDSPQTPVSPFTLTSILILTFNQEMAFFEPPLPQNNKIKYKRNIKAPITPGQARTTDDSRQTYLPNALTNLDILMMHIYGPDM